MVRISTQLLQASGMNHDGLFSKSPVMKRTRALSAAEAEKKRGREAQLNPLFISHLEKKKNSES